jgi:hypothetical protein
MRVLIVMTAREVGGAELYVERLTRTLSSRCDFTIVLPTHPRLEAAGAAPCEVMHPSPPPRHRGSAADYLL